MKSVFDTTDAQCKHKYSCIIFLPEKVHGPMVVLNSH